MRPPGKLIWPGVVLQVRGALGEQQRGPRGRSSNAISTDAARPGRSSTARSAGDIGPVDVREDSFTRVARGRRGRHEAADE